MKQRTILLVFLLLPGILLAQTGKVFDHLTMESKILNMERRYAVYLPPDYETSERSYPVLYLLHGGGDDQTGWIQFGEVLRIADQAILDGTATAMVIIMPDGMEGRRGFFNAIDGNWNYEDFIFEEFIPYVEKKYRIKSEKRYRAVSGLSMGGGGTFMWALHHPELFSSACPLSASCGPLSLEQMERRIEGSGLKISKEEVEKYYRRHSVLPLIEDLSVKELKSVRWYIDCGDDDFLFEGNSLAHIALTKKEIPHEYRVRDGAHTWTYWRESLPEVLRFCSDHFHQH